MQAGTPTLKPEEFRGQVDKSARGQFRHQGAERDPEQMRWKFRKMPECRFA